MMNFGTGEFGTRLTHFDGLSPSIRQMDFTNAFSSPQNIARPRLVVSARALTLNSHTLALYHHKIDVMEFLQ